MAVNFAATGPHQSFPLTSPHNKNPSDNLKWIASEINFTDRTVWITYPFPDRLEFKAFVSNDVMVVADHSGKTAGHLSNQIDNEIHHHIAHFPAVDGISLHKKGYSYASFVFEHNGLHLAFLELKRQKSNDYVDWTLKISLNPKKLGLGGLCKFADLLELAFGFIELSKIVEFSKIVRIDCAVDLIGVHPIDLVPRIPKQGKREVYFGNGGSPETISMHELKNGKSNPNAPAYNTLGAERLKIYDRNSKQNLYGEKLDYGDLPVTRIEVPRRWNSFKPTFENMFLIKNMLAGVNVGYANKEELTASQHWRRFCEQIFVRGPENVRIEKPIASGLKHYQRYLNFEADLISSKNWVGWQTGTELKLAQNEIPPSELIGNFPAEAYDMHTREGRAAINASEVNFTLDENGNWPLRQRLYNAIFRVEGGLLAEEVVSSQLSRVTGAAMLYELGSTNVFLQKQLITQTLQSLPQLNFTRRKFAR